MGVAAKHAYRFWFLKSEHWSDLRIARLAKDGARCRICYSRSISNDSHHIRYPSEWSRTTVEDLRTMCRSCHDRAHRIMREIGTSNWSEILHVLKLEVRPMVRFQLTEFLARVRHIRLAWYALGATDPDNKRHGSSVGSES